MYCILILSILSSKTDIDNCASHPCKNNGTCTDRVNGFNCSCAPGFNGSQCETGNYSQNSFFFRCCGPGSVFNSISYMYCILILSILSSKTDIDNCASHPCKNNGTCTDRVNGFNCSCAPGFNGSQCETGNYSQNSFFFRFSEFLISFHVACSAFIFKSNPPGK